MKLTVIAEATIDEVAPAWQTDEIRSAIKEDIEDCLRFTGYGRAVTVEVRIDGL